MFGNNFSYLSNLRPAYCNCFAHHCHCSGRVRTPIHQHSKPNPNQFKPEFYEDNVLDDNSTVLTSNKFKIVVVLDESGSMENIRDSMLKSLNDLIKEQKQVKERPASFTLVKFSDKVKRVREIEPLETTNLLEPRDYEPSGSTALYDAIGSTINRFRNEKDVLLVIITDGQENASRKYNKSYVNEKIEQMKNKNGWTYVYLSCDLSTSQQGKNIGCTNSSYSSNVVRDVNSYGEFVSNNLNSAIRNFRTNGLSVQQQINQM